MKRLLAISAAMLVLSGCNIVETTTGNAVATVHSWDGTVHSLGSPLSATQTFFALDVVSVINTQKTIDDHVISMISGKDCSTVRASMGEKYCQEAEHKLPTVLRVSYCYKNLSSFTCYDRPLNNGSELLGTRVEHIPVRNDEAP